MNIRLIPIYKKEAILSDSLFLHILHDLIKGNEASLTFVL